MPYMWGEHVGELELRIDAPTPEAVFADALAALHEVLADERPSSGAAPQHHDVEVTGRDLPALLAAWIEELVFLAETEGFVPAAVEALALEDGALRARVGGHAGTPPHLVKAVTYHRLAFAPSGGRWHATAVLDV